MNKNILFALGPKITVSLTFESKKLKSASLSISEKFQCILLGELEDTVIDPFMTFLEFYGKKKPNGIKLPLFESNKQDYSPIAGGSQNVKLEQCEAKTLSHVKNYRITPFRQKVLQELQKVPFGKTLTYGQLASKSGHPNAARAVGSACHINPFPLFIPCHRVIASGGHIGGFAYDIELKKLLLDFERS
jgi:O-6-methylguanine DNA methyltransferase